MLDTIHFTSLFSWLLSKGEWLIRCSDTI